MLSTTLPALPPHCKFNFSRVFELANYKRSLCSSCKPMLNQSQTWLVSGFPRALLSLAVMRKRALESLLMIFDVICSNFGPRGALWVGNCVIVCNFRIFIGFPIFLALFLYVGIFLSVACINKFPSLYVVHWFASTLLALQVLEEWIIHQGTSNLQSTGKSLFLHASSYARRTSNVLSLLWPCDIRPE